MQDLINELEKHLTSVEIVKLLNNTYINPYALERYAVENMICPSCYSNLSIHKSKEHSEHFGFDCCENISELKCNNCDWSLD